MAIIDKGVRWPFMPGVEATVRPTRVPNNASALATAVPAGCVEALGPRAWVSAVLGELTAAGITRAVPREQVTLVCALSMALKGSGKYRLCLDLRPLNAYLRKLRMQLETLRRVRHTLRRGDWMLTVDIVSAYHNFLVAPGHQKFCGFEWEGAYYVYAALSFGSSAAPALFQQMMDLIAAHLRSKGVRCGTYIDDWWFAFERHADAVAFAAEVVCLFRSLGLTINEEKSVLVPTRRLIVLGTVVDTHAFAFSMPAKRVLAAERAASALLDAHTRGEQVAARDLAKAVGRIVSMGIALGRGARRMTRCCYRDLANATGTDPDASRMELRAAWRVSMRLSDAAAKELAFWLHPVAMADGGQGPPLIWLVALRGSSIAETGVGATLFSWEVASVAASDASDWAVGCWLQASGTAAYARELGRERLGGAEGHLSSTVRELLGVERTIEMGIAGGKLPPGELIFFCDNQGASMALQFGSRKAPIHLVCMRIWARCMRAGVSLSPCWVRRTREGVMVCDFGSKRTDDQAWQLAPDIFSEIDADISNPE